MARDALFEPTYRVLLNLSHPPAMPDEALSLASCHQPHGYFLPACSDPCGPHRIDSRCVQTSKPNHKAENKGHGIVRIVSQSSAAKSSAIGFTDQGGPEPQATFSTSCVVTARRNVVGGVRSVRRTTVEPTNAHPSQLLASWRAISDETRKARCQYGRFLVLSRLVHMPSRFLDWLRRMLRSHMLEMMLEQTGHA